MTYLTAKRAMLPRDAGWFDAATVPSGLGVFVLAMWPGLADETAGPPAAPLLTAYLRRLCALLCPDEQAIVAAHGAALPDVDHDGWADAEAWCLNVLALPYGGPRAGRDGIGGYFSPKTETHADRVGVPAVLYNHGRSFQEGRPATVELIGRVTERRVRWDGVWMAIELDRSAFYARRVWSAARRGAARASTATFAELVEEQDDGHIATWVPLELSLFDAEGGRQPCNGYAVALPAAVPLPDDHPAVLLAIARRMACDATLSRMAEQLSASTVPEHRGREVYSDMTEALQG